jgi:glycine/D-amino acid oxidase-like deaminating enzyme
MSSATSLSLSSRTPYAFPRRPHSSSRYFKSGLRRIITSASQTPAQDLSCDVVIVGAGIIGLMTAHALLQADPALSVIVLDAKEPCAGATGAGQGYVWLCHRDAASPAWEVAVRSKTLWAEQLQGGLASPMKQSDVEWQQTGSMLIASTAEEAEKLKEREEILRHAGVDVTFINSSKAREIEPALNSSISTKGGALIVPNDSQINGRKTAAAVLAACRLHSGRFQDLFYESCEGLATSSTGRVEGVVTPLRTIMAGAGVVMASGAWGGTFLAQHMNKTQWLSALLPRRGLLLEMPRPPSMPEIHRGLMEVGYTQHYNAENRSKVANEKTNTAAEITFTATTSASGSLLIGSSREFSGWDSSGPVETVDAIMDRATEFLPGLAGVDQRKEISVRVGLRPFSPTGPMVGPLCEGLFIAAGHEGSGLTLGPATAELLVEDILGREGHSLSERAVASLRPSPELTM